MPLPERAKNEPRADFVSRCMADDVMRKEYPDEKQRAAICNRQADKPREQSRKPALLRAGLIDAPRFFRAAPARGIATATAIERDGGQYGGGLIRDVAVVTRGEAVGHDMWIDDTMLDQVVAGINASRKGLKSRFTHPSLSGDGLGKALGRVRNGRRDTREGGKLVRGDLHLYETAHDAPDGDLAKYVMDLAHEDPEAFGTSIAFEPDVGAEDKFATENEDKDGNFKSPDEDNAKNLFHARIGELAAVDVVDNPAANPSGLFHRGDGLAMLGDELLAYVFGRSEMAPDTREFGMHPDRIKAYVARWLDQAGLALIPKPPEWRLKAQLRLAELDHAKR